MIAIIKSIIIQQGIMHDAMQIFALKVFEKAPLNLTLES